MSHSNTPIVKNLRPLTTQFSSLRCVSAITTLQNSTPKLAGQTPESISQEATYHGILARTSSRYKAFEKLLWKLSQDAFQVILKSNVDPNISRSSDSFSTVLAIINWGVWGYIVCYLWTTIVFHAFYFISQRLHHSLTLPRSQFRYCATVTLTSGNRTTNNKVESSA